MLPDAGLFCERSAARRRHEPGGILAALRSFSMTSAADGGPVLTPEQISAIDAAHLWHPYSTIGAEAVPPVVAVGARGAWLTLVRDGNQVQAIDAMSSWWTAMHGHGHPVLDAAMTRQLATMSHVMFGGLTHEPAARLAQLLVEITPSGLETVFFSDSGSVSVEVAVKMALQYWRSRGLPGKRRLMTWRGGYHGDTFTPMSICDPDGGMHSLWTDVLARPGVRAAGTPRLRPRLQRGIRGTAGRACRRAGRRHRRAGRPGCRRDAVPRPAIPDRSARHLPTARRTADLRRDRHRVRSDRRVVRRRPGRRQPRHHVRRQGPDRRLPEPGRDVVHRRRRPHDQYRAAGCADARPDVHGQPAGVRRRRWPRSNCC